MPHNASITGNIVDWAPQLLIQTQTQETEPEAPEYFFGFPSHSVIPSKMSPSDRPLPSEKLPNKLKLIDLIIRRIPKKALKLRKKICGSHLSIKRTITLFISTNEVVIDIIFFNTYH